MKINVIPVSEVMNCMKLIRAITFTLNGILSWKLQNLLHNSINNWMSMKNLRDSQII
jgi:hypothetical protein